MPKQKPDNYKRTSKTTAVKTWTHGDELPETLEVEQFMNGLGVQPETLKQLMTKMKIQPLRQYAAGQTKGWPSVQLFMRGQMEQMLTEWDKMHVPPPPSKEERMHQDIETILQRHGNVEAVLDRLQSTITGMDETITARFVYIEKLILQLRDETHTERTFEPLPVDKDNANEVPSQMAQDPEPARPILRRRQN